MKKPVFSYKTASEFIADEKLNSYFEKAVDAKKILEEKSGAGNDFLGWLDLPVNYDKEEFERVKKASNKIKLIKFKENKLLNENFFVVWVAEVFFLVSFINNANIKHLPYVSGFFVCLPCENAQELCDKLKEKHTYLVPMSDDIVRIAVCSLNKEEISELVLVLSEVL